MSLLPERKQKESSRRLCTKMQYTNQSAKGAEYDSQGKREARRPWVTELKSCRPEKGVIPVIFRPFRPHLLVRIATRGDALRACPWLSYFRAVGALVPTFCTSRVSAVGSLI
jgi:hypothetical protein